VQVQDRASLGLVGLVAMLLLEGLHCSPMTIVVGSPTAIPIAIAIFAIEGAVAVTVAVAVAVAVSVAVPAAAPTVTSTTAAVHAC
jgi:hypothetical protein